MADKIIKSVFWLGVCSFTGYALLKLATKGEQPTDLRGLEPPLERRKQSQQFMDVLSSASKSNTAFYRSTKDEIEKSVRK